MPFHYYGMPYMPLRMITTDRTLVLLPAQLMQTDITEHDVRRIVREEIAKLPIRYHVPDMPEDPR